MAYWESGIADCALSLKIQLAVMAEKLVDDGQPAFAGHLYDCLDNLSMQMDEMEGGSNMTGWKNRAVKVIEYLREIENIMLACKVGVELQGNGNIIALVRELKSSVTQAMLFDWVSHKPFYGNQN
jgi:hypothetical protein